VEDLSCSKPSGFNHSAVALGRQFALLLGKKNLIVGETGVTMYQPRFTFLGRITVTTHPKLLQITGLVTKEILGEKLRIIRPSENMTKAEIAAFFLASDSIKPSVVQDAEVESG
jgi:hypothetical protein